MAEKETTSTEIRAESSVKKEQKRYVRPREIAAYAITSYGINNLTSFIGSTKQYFMMSFLGLTGKQYGFSALFQQSGMRSTTRFRALLLTDSEPDGADCARF